MPPAVEVKALSRSFGARVALRSLTLTVDEGEVFGLLGSNGAGKTTTIRILTTLLRPTSGTARVLGHDVVREADAVRRGIGVVSERVHLYPDLTAEQNLRFFGRLYGLDGADLEARVDDVLERVGLEGRRRDALATYSFGMRKRAEIACALVHGPRVLFMDEATTGVDPQNALRIRQLVTGLAREGVAVLWATHLMDEPQRLCRRVAVMARGEVRAVGAPRELARRIEREKTVEVRVERSMPPERLRLLAGVLRRHGLPVRWTDAEEGLLRAVVAHDHDLGDVLVVLRDFGQVRSVHALEPSLEDVFLHYAADASF